MDVDNPWQVESIEAFYVLKCPECTFYTKNDKGFYDHAVKNHHLSVSLFGKPKVEIINHGKILDLPIKIEKPENSCENEETETLSEKTFKTIVEGSNGKIELKGSKNNEPFKCKFCVKSFSDLNNMKTHLKVHAKAMFGKTNVLKPIYNMENLKTPNKGRIPNSDKPENKESFTETRNGIPENSTKIKSEFIITKSQTLYETDKSEIDVKSTPNETEGIKIVNTTMATKESPVDFSKTKFESPKELHMVGDVKKHDREKIHPKSPGAPKQPLSSYEHFLNDRRKVVRKEFPQMSMSEISKTLANEWSRLRQEEKQKYAERQGNLSRGIDNQSHYIEVSKGTILWNRM